MSIVESTASIYSCIFLTKNKRILMHLFGTIIYVDVRYYIILYGSLIRGT